MVCACMSGRLLRLVEIMLCDMIMKLDVSFTCTCQCELKVFIVYEDVHILELLNTSVIAVCICRTSVPVQAPLFVNNAGTPQCLNSAGTP